VFFVAGSNQLNKAHVQFLESQLVSRARAVKQTEVENGNNPAEPTLSEADRADMAVFLQHILGVLPVLGIRAFEGTPDSPGKSDSANLICQGRGVKAIGDDTPQGFVIRAGSHAAGDEAPSLNKHFPNVTELRSKLVALGVLVADGKQLKFSQDYTFTSPSLASSIVLARSSNGRVDWKDSSGRTLRQIQEAQAKS
jgi:hypothetical protein